MFRTQGQYMNSYHWQDYINQKLPYSMYSDEENSFTVRFSGLLTQRTGLMPQFMRGLRFTANIEKDRNVRFVFIGKSHFTSKKVCKILLFNI